MRGGACARGRAECYRKGGARVRLARSRHRELSLVQVTGVCFDLCEAPCGRVGRTKRKGSVRRGCGPSTLGECGECECVTGLSSSLQVESKEAIFIPTRTRQTHTAPFLSPLSNMATDPLAAVLAAHAAHPVRPPPPGARVHKEESVYGFDTPLSPGGLFLNLATWQVRACVCVCT